MTVTIYQDGVKKVLFPESPCLLSQLLNESQTHVDMPCGGRGKCLKCRVRAEGCLSSVTEEERSVFTEEQLRQGWRLACLTTAEGDVTMYAEAPKKQLILTAGALPELPLDPLGKNHGISVDIGTTTVAAYLYDLAEGKLLGTASMANPQRAFGADVISRLGKAKEDGLGRDEAIAIRQGLNKLFARLLKTHRVDASDIDSVVLTGNTAMLYLLTEQPVDSIISVPFIQDRWYGEYLTAAQLELELNPETPVYLSRCISAYVGGDITSSAMTAELFRRPADAPTCLLMDIGTNGEMILFHQGKMFCCSTAAGPTFEGAGLHMGMNAGDGAISKVKLTGNTMELNIIGDVEAKGICGSGIIDAVAALLDAEVLDETGRMDDEDPNWEACMTEYDNRPAFRFPGTQVLVTQKDIREVQLAKSAICAGILSMLHVAGCTTDDVQEVFIAGGFGNYMDARSAERIGLLPGGFAAKVKPIGNAAGAGASMVLLSETMRKISEEMSKSIDTLELSTDPVFIKEFTDQMLFPEGE